MKLKIGAAISQDGVTWGRIEGSDPSSACMVPYDTKDPDMQAQIKDETGRLMDIPEELYCVSTQMQLQIANMFNIHLTFVFQT